MLRPHLSLAREKLCDAGAVVGEGIDAGKTLGDKLLLQPDGLVIAQDKRLGKHVIVAVAAAPAKFKLDLFS